MLVGFSSSKTPLPPPLCRSMALAPCSFAAFSCTNPSKPSFSSLARRLPSNSTLITIPATRPLRPSLLRGCFSLRPPPPPPAAAGEITVVDGIGVPTDPPKVILEVKDLTAVIKESRQQILSGVNLTIKEGEVHAVMGKNGSGKSTFAKVLVGHPDYEVTGGSVSFKGENLLEMEPEERSHAGLFMSFQSPVEIPGVDNMTFLNMALNAKNKKRGLPELSPLEFFGPLSTKLAAVNMSPDFLNRNVNEGFSGGEKKRNEILQLAVLGADLAILDEIDSGLDVDALRDVAKAVNELLTPKNSILMITHYQRLLNYIMPGYIHIMEDGTIVRTGDSSLAKQLEEKGFDAISAV